MAAAPGPSSCHTTYILEPTAAICGNPENPESIVLILTGSLKFSPSFILTLKNISAPSSDSSCHTTYTLEPTAAICGFSDITSLSLRLIEESKLSPLFVLREKNMSNMPGVLSCHTAYTFEPTAAICGNAENPESASLRLDISSKLNPSEYTSCKENDDESKINEKIVTSTFSL